LRWAYFVFILFFVLPACAPTPVQSSAARLYVFDASSLHLNHYEHCLHLTDQAGSCDALTPPPPGTSYGDWLAAYGTLIFLTTLQGNVNRDAPRLYLLHDYQRQDTPGVDTFWLEQYQAKGQPYGWLADTELVDLPNLAAVLDTFTTDIDGLVVWDPAVPATLNVATTIAGVENLAVVRAGSPLEATLSAHWPVKKSLVDMFPLQPSPTGSAKADAYLWAVENYLETGLANPQFLAWLLDGWPATLYTDQKMTRGGVYALERDYVVQQQGFAFDLSPWPVEAPVDDPDQPRGTDLAALQKILATAQEQAGGKLIKMWGYIPWYEKYSNVGGISVQNPVKGEWAGTWLFSEYGGYLQGGGGDVFGLAMANVSVHKFGPQPAERTAPPPPTEADLIAQGYLTADGRVAPNHTFVLFYMGDYDLAHPVAVLLANYAGQAGTPWLDARRGEIPLAWGFNPALVEDIPGIMAYLYATQTDTDYFVGANSGAGYINPDGLSEIGLLRWLWRSRRFYRPYGYDVQGFLLNGEGAAMSQRRLDGFSLIAPGGIVTPDFETDEPWPRLQWGTPLTAVASEALAGTPDDAAQAVHTVYRRTVLDEGRPPFLVFRTAFQSPTLLWGVRDRIQAQDAAGEILADDGSVLHPNYTVVDPYTFFFLLERQLRGANGK